MIGANNEAAEAQRRLLDAVAKRYNEATPLERRTMGTTLAKTKATAMSSVRGLKSIFPALKRKLSVTDEGKNT